jgi:demethylmenaquinone methyltransferase/2-methoxy-6-polyprenyl-1,4-benzoquinol methylase
MTEKDNTGAGKTHFGFQTVDEAEKASRVREVFDTVAGNYDLMNDLMSGGVHRLWKDAMVSWLNPRPGMRTLDLAGGTGDIARRILRRTSAKGDPGHVIVCDINAEMLRAGMARGQDHLGWLCADAERLPLPDTSVDACTIAFGIRNVTHMDRALGEIRRVLRPGGRFLCLEFSHVEVPGLDRLYDLYSFHVIPRLGRAVAGDEAAYRYLVESIHRFPDAEGFAQHLREAGFARVSFRRLTGGVAALHSGWRV